MTTTKRAARSLAGWVMEPPIERGEAGQILGTGVSPEAWQKIELAFDRYSDCLDDLDATKASRKNEDRSWHVRQAQTAKALETALSLAQRALDKHGQFMEEASENYSLSTYGFSASPEADARNMVDLACKKLLHALVLVERAQSRELDVPTAATARDDLVRAVADALEADGIEIKASSGWDIESLDGSTRLADLAPFVQLIAALRIGDEKKPAAFAAWVRSALAGRNRG